MNDLPLLRDDIAYLPFAHNGKPRKRSLQQVEAVGERPPPSDPAAWRCCHFQVPDTTPQGISTCTSLQQGTVRAPYCVSLLVCADSLGSFGGKGFRNTQTVRDRRGCREARLLGTWCPFHSQLMKCIFAHAQSSPWEDEDYQTQQLLISSSNYSTVGPWGDGALPQASSPTAVRGGRQHLLHCSLLLTPQIGNQRRGQRKAQVLVLASPPSAHFYPSRAFDSTAYFFGNQSLETSKSLCGAS